LKENDFKSQKFKYQISNMMGFCKLKSFLKI